MVEIKVCVVDTGVLIEYYTGSPLGEKVKEILKRPEILVYLHAYSLTEFRYILCRIFGQTTAEKESSKLERALEIVRHPSTEVIAAQIKCAESISLVDCFAIASAIMYQIPVLFKKEIELEKVMNSNARKKKGRKTIDQEFGFDLIFLEDLHL